MGSIPRAPLGFDMDCVAARVREKNFLSILIFFLKMPYNSIHIVPE